MISAGNDIVSLGAIDIPRTKQLKFYSRILSPSEQALYKSPAYADIPFEHFVWLLWSIKESAFKYLQRLNPGLVFSPTKFIVTRLDVPLGYAPIGFEAVEITQCGFGKGALSGAITYGDVSLYSRSVIYKELIVSVVNGDDNFSNTCWGVRAIVANDPVAQSAGARALLTQCLQSNFNLDAAIAKNPDGIPSVLVNELAIPISLSHHGYFVGFALPTDLISGMGNKTAI